MPLSLTPFSPQESATQLTVGLDSTVDSDSLREVSPIPGCGSLSTLVLRQPKFNLNSMETKLALRCSLRKALPRDPFFI